MLIDFSKMEESVMKNFKGGEKELHAAMFADENNRILHGKLEPGASIGLHKHETNSEIIYILQGNGKVIFEDTTESIEAGMCHYCPEGHSHSLINDSREDLIFFAVVPQHMVAR